MCRGLHRRRDPLAPEIGHPLDAERRPDPELRGRDLNVVDEKAPAAAERQIVGDDAAGREDVELTPRHRLEDFRSGVELVQFEIDPFAVERAAIEPGPDVSVHGDNVEITEPNSAARLRNGWRRVH